MQFAGGFFLMFATIVAAHPSIDTTVITPKHGPALEWWENAVFYQIYPRSFKDSNGDGVGDINGITEKLDYLKELGVDAAWLSPIFKSPMADFGYDISDFYDVDPTFGTLQDLEILFQKANETGLKIILDFVPNHSSDQCEWFKKSIKREGNYTDYYIWHDGKKDTKGNRIPPNNWQSIFYGPAWTWNDERKQYYYHQFAKEQPDLNYRSPHVIEEMTKVFRFWLSKGVAGFRIDAINHLFEDAKFRDEPLSNKTKDPNSHEYTEHIYTKDLPEMYEMVYKFREIADEYQEEYGGERRVLMTEAYTNSTEYPKYFKSADGNKNGSQIPFNFVLMEQLDKTSTTNTIKKTIDDRIGAVPAGTRLNWVVGNHDQPRVGSRFGPQKIDGFLTLVMTLPGIAVTYNGEEIGMLDHRDISYADMKDPQACNVGETGNWRELSRDPVRTPFQWESSENAGFMPEEAAAKPWLPLHPNYRDVNVETQKKDERSTFKYYKELLELRKHDTFVYGTYNSTVVDENVLAYVRELAEHDTFVVLINFGARESTVNLTELTASFSGKAEIVAAGADTCFSTGEKLPSDQVLLRKYNALILKPASHCDGGDGCDHHGDSSTATTNIASVIGLLVISIAHFIF